MYTHISVSLSLSIYIYIYRGLAPTSGRHCADLILTATGD